MENSTIGGHCGRADDYHYQLAPKHLQVQIGADKSIAYALDRIDNYVIFEKKIALFILVVFPVNSDECDLWESWRSTRRNL